MLLERLARFIRYVYALLGGAMVLVVLVIAVNTYVFTLYRVDGSSMRPTLSSGQLVPVNLLAYDSAAPKDGDVVIVRYAGDQQVRFVKRVVGLPGETVEFQGEPLTLGVDQFFVEGDNRGHSTDSRAYGPISRSQILGRVAVGTSKL